MRASLAALSLLLISPAWCQDPQDDTAAREAAREYVRALDAYRATGIDTRLNDAVTDVAFLDGYNPVRYVPMGEMPRLPGWGYLLVAPGDYELDAASFCLNSGAFSPGGGDGYVVAPLKGVGAGILRKLLIGWLDHPETSQGTIQVLAWAVDGRVDPDTLAAGPREAARTLLSDEDWQTWKGLVRGEEPELAGGLSEADLERMEADLGSALGGDEAAADNARLAELTKQMTQAIGDQARMEQLMAEVTALTERMNARLESANRAYAGVQAELSSMLQAQQMAYEELAARFAPEGDPVPPEGSRQIPLTRWSYDASGFFIRYVPVSSYTRCLVQVSVPCEHSVVRDAEGRITRVVGPDGTRLDVAYGGAPEPLAGQTALRRAPISSATFSPVQGEGSEWAGGWALVGSPESETEADPAVAGRVSRLEALRASLDAVCSSAAAAAGQPAPAPLSGPALADVLDLASMCDAVAEVTAYVPVADPTEIWNAEEPAARTPHMELLYGALENALRDAVVGVAGPPAGAVAIAPRARGGATIVPAALRSAARALPALDPSERVAQPGNTGRQRLGVAPRPSPESVDKEVLRRGMRSIEFVQDLLSIASGVIDPVGWVAQRLLLGQGIPSMLFDKMVSVIFEMAMEISKALGGDPPRPDFTTFAVPLAPNLPQITGDGVGKRKLAAAQAAFDALLDWLTNARAAQVSLDRMGGAAQAGDRAWAWSQAEAVVYHKRLAGLSMVRLADAVEALSTMLTDEGAEWPLVSEEEARARVEALRSGELSDLDRQAAALLGVSEDDLREARTAKPTVSVDELLDRDYLSALSELPEALREAGEVWSRLPRVPAPGGAGEPVA